MKKQQRNNILFLKKVLRENLFKYSLFVSFRIQHEANKQNNNKNNEKNMEKSTEKKKADFSREIFLCIYSKF